MKVSSYEQWAKVVISGKENGEIREGLSVTSMKKYDTGGRSLPPLDT